MSAKKIIRAIRNYSNFLITSHVDSEADAIGSELALASLLQKLGRKAYIVNNDMVPDNCRFLPGSKKILKRINKNKFEAVFIIDCPDKERIGAVVKLIDQDTPIINIDHHIGNKNFGHVNWVVPSSSSTGELIFLLFQLARVKLNSSDAINIYTAIMTDTGSFRHANTTGRAMSIASKLLEFRINPERIYAQAYENNTVRDLAILAKIFSRISFITKNKIAMVRIDQNLYRMIKGKHQILDKVLDFGRSVTSVKIVLVFCQKAKQVYKISLRSKAPINVQRIAHFFGGGGHRQASGCLIKGDFSQVRKKVIARAKKAI